MLTIGSIKGLKRNLTDCACPESGDVTVVKSKKESNQGKIVVILK